MSGVVCVGREVEQAELRKHVGDAAAGTGGLVLLEGPAGIGKTTIARCCMEMAREAGGSAHLVSAIGPDLEPALGMWARLAAAQAVAGQEAPAALVQGTVDDLHPHGRYAAVLSLIAGLQPTPAVVVLDDLHAADESSLTILSQLVPALSSMDVLVVGTLRGPRAHPRAEGQAILEGIAGWVPTIAVGRFDETETVEVAVAIAGRAAASWAREHVSFLWERSGGNPLVLRALLDELGVASGARPDAVALAGLPTTAGVLAEVLARRLSTLAASTREVLAAVAVAGDHATPAIVEEIVGRPVAHDLGVAADVGVVEPGVGEAICFVHPALAESVIASAPDQRRLHARVAQCLDRRGDPADAVVILRHLDAAGDLADRATLSVAALAAADQALRLGDQAAAAWALDQALATGSASDPVDLLLRASEAHHLAGHQAASWDRARRAADLAGVDRPVDLACAALAFGRGRDYATDAPAAVELLRRALGALGADHELRPEVLALLSVLEMSLPIPVEPGTLPTIDDAGAGSGEPASNVAWHWVTRPEIARPLADEALALARARGDEELIGRVAMSWRQAHCAPEYLGERMALTGRAFETAKSASDRVAAAVATVLDFLEAGRRDAVDRALNEMTGLAAATGDAAWRWRTAQLQAMVALASGQPELAEQRSAQAFAHGVQAGENGRWVVRTAQLLMSALLMSEDVTEELEFVSSTMESFAYPPLRAGAAYGLALHGRPEAAEYLPGIVEHVVADEGREASWMMTLAFTADAVRAAQDAELAARLVPVLEPVADRIAVDGLGLYCHGCVARPLAGLLALLDRHDEARQYLALACERDRAAGLTYFVASGVLDQLALERGERGGVDDAWRSRVRVAADEARAAGYGAIERRARELLTEDAHTLTDRQLSVLTALAAGQTYQQIGDELGYSHSTIRHEAMRVYAAMGASDRAEAVEVARRRGLLDADRRR